MADLLGYSGMDEHAAVAGLDGGTGQNSVAGDRWVARHTSILKKKQRHREGNGGSRRGGTSSQRVRGTVLAGGYGGKKSAIVVRWIRCRGVVVTWRLRICVRGCKHRDHGRCGKCGMPG